MPDIYVAPKRKKVPKKVRAAKKKVERKTEAEKARKVHTVNPLAAYASSPKNIHFETQEPKEEIILLLRRHWITNLPWIFWAILMVFTPFILRFFPLLTLLPFRYQVMAVIIWYLLTIAFIFEQFLGWLFNVNIITDERIVDIDFYSLLYKEVSDCKIDQIQDVTYKMGGVTRAMFNYGDVFIQTAAERPQFEFLAIPKPDRVAAILRDLVTEEEKERLEGRIR